MYALISGAREEKEAGSFDLMGVGWRVDCCSSVYSNWYCGISLPQAWNLGARRRLLRPES